MKRTHSHNQGFSMIELLIVVTIGTVLTVMAIPSLTSILRNMRSDGNTRQLYGAVTLAKMRGAASFSKARIRADISARTFQIEVLDKSTAPPSWKLEGGVETLSPGISYGYASLTTAPSYTQTTIGQAPACQTDAQTAANSVGTVSNTACIVFSSRGIPVDNTGIPTNTGALYITDTTDVQAVTVNAAGSIRTWRTDKGAASWKNR
jgi:prepilin-type N-terminal cleavage/methylation domain-containing protein